MWVNLVKLGNQSICYKHLHIKAATNHNIKVWPLVYFLCVTSITYAERGRERERERERALVQSVTDQTFCTLTMSALAFLFSLSRSISLPSAQTVTRLSRSPVLEKAPQ